MAKCKKQVGRGIISYPCTLVPEHDGPCMAVENRPSQHARRAWELATELEALAATPPQASGPRHIANYDNDGEYWLEDEKRIDEKRQVPHPGAEPLSAFQGPARTSQTGLMEHEEAGVSGPPLSTIDTNAPGQGHTLGTRAKSRRRPETVWAGDDRTRTKPELGGQPVAVKQAPTKTRSGDQPLPAVNNSPFIQDLVVGDIEARKAVGIKRYGTPLQPFNGRNVDQDLYEELIDATTYLRQRLVERADMAEAVASLTKLLEETYIHLSVEVWDYLEILYQGTIVTDE